MTGAKSWNRLFYGWIAVLVIGISLGIWGAATLLINGHATTGTGGQIPWGIFVPGYVFFVAASAGCVIVSLGYVLGIKKFALVMKRAVFLAIVTLVAGGILIILDLGSPQTAFYFLVSPNFQSPMWWMSFFYSLYLVLLLIEFYFIRKNDGKKLQVMSLLTALSAIAVHSTLGAIFGFAAVRTYFGGALSPVYFILIAIIIGIALLLMVTILQYRLSRTQMSPELNGVVLDLSKLLGVVLGIALFFTLWKDLAGIRSTLATTALGYEHVLSAWWYWVLVIILGLIVPFILLLNPKTRKLNVIAFATPLVLIGMFAARFEFTIGGQIAPVIENLQHLAYPLGSYSVTFVEVTIMILSVTVAALLYTIGARTLSLEKVPQHD